MPRSLRSPARQRCLFAFAAGLLLAPTPSPARAEEPPLDYSLVRHQLPIGAGAGTLTAERSPNIIVAALPTVFGIHAFRRERRCLAVRLGNKAFRGYTAKEACSCLFVMEQTEAFCRSWVRASPAVASWSFDEDEKSVRAGAILFWGAKAT